MSEIETGGPAFPPMHDPETHAFGMTLRDYFAAKAMQMEMQSAMARYESGEIEADDWGQVQQWVAEYAYDMADAMLKARAQSTTTVGRGG